VKEEKGSDIPDELVSFYKRLIQVNFINTISLPYYSNSCFFFSSSWLGM